MCFLVSVSRVTSTSGGEENLSSNISTRFFVSGMFLVIFPVLPGDQGTYFCTASNPVGQVRSSAELLVFAPSNIVQVEVLEFSNPNAAATCHLTGQAEFEVRTISDRNY